MVLFGYPDRSAAALLAGDLPLRYCNTRSAWKLPTWRLPDRGRVRDLVADSVGGARFLGCGRLGGGLFPPPVDRAGDSFDDRVLGCVKRIRLNRKTPAHLARVGTFINSESRSRVWKRLRVSKGPLVFSLRFSCVAWVSSWWRWVFFGSQGRGGIIGGCIGPRPQALHERG